MASAVGDEEATYKAFLLARSMLQQRISLLMNLRIEALDRLALTGPIAAIGQTSAAPGQA